MADQIVILAAGDVLCTRGNNWASRLIRIGAAVLDKPNLVNHVAIVDHLDKKNEWVCVEGRPGGVGPAPAAKYLSSPFTLNNANQPKTPEQRQQIVAAMQSMKGREYDWGGIALDAAHAVGVDLPDRWTGNWNGAQVVCSSLAAWVYAHVGLARPPGDPRTITPGDWADWIIRNRYNR